MSYVGGTEPVPFMTWATPFLWAAAVFTPPAFLAAAMGADLSTSLKAGVGGVVVALLAFLIWCWSVSRSAAAAMVKLTEPVDPGRRVVAKVSVIGPDERTVVSAQIDRDTMAALAAAGMPELQDLSDAELVQLVDAINRVETGGLALTRVMPAAELVSHHQDAGSYR